MILLIICLLLWILTSIWSQQVHLGAYRLIKPIEQLLHTGQGWRVAAGITEPKAGSVSRTCCSWTYTHSPSDLGFCHIQEQSSFHSRVLIPTPPPSWTTYNNLSDALSLLPVWQNYHHISQWAYMPVSLAFVGSVLRLCSIGSREVGEVLWGCSEFPIPILTKAATF